MKKSLKSVLVMLACMAALPVMATSSVNVDKLAVKTLPAQVYTHLQKGKMLSLLWKSPDFEPSQSYKIGKVQWKAHEHIGEAISYLNKQVPLLATKTLGYYTLDLAVTDAKEASTVFLFYKNGFCVVEGEVKDPSGKVVAAFVTKEKALEEHLDSCLDKVFSGIQQELFQ